MSDRESSVAGVVLGYIAYVSQTALAVLYVILLTRLIDLSEYGYYNALTAILGVISLFFPTLGVDRAIAREAAIMLSQGVDIRSRLSAMLLITIILTALYVLAVLILAPLYVAMRIPERFLPIVYLYLVYIVLQSLNGFLASYLWIAGRLKSQALGIMIGGLVFRSSETLLIFILRNVYAIIISMILGQILTLAYYIRVARVFYNPLEGVVILKRNLRQYVKIGFQNWFLGYLGSVANNIITYIIYETLGADSVALYSISLYMLGAVSSFISSIVNVFGSRLSHALGSERDLNSILRDYIDASLVSTSVLSQLLIVGLPLLPMTGVVYGDYARSIPYAVALFGVFTLGAPVSIYSTYYWLIERGWTSIKISLIALSVNISLALLTVRSIGLYSTALAMLVSSIVAEILYELSNSRDRNRSLTLLSTYTVLPLLSSLAYVSTDTWPLSQIVMLIFTILVSYYIKPLPRSILSQIPFLFRDLLLLFTRE
ncbi:MAG: oligosaccharide flippase family protein [Sulfolobales archaeon]